MQIVKSPGIVELWIKEHFAHSLFTFMQKAWAIFKQLRTSKHCLLTVCNKGVNTYKLAVSKELRKPTKHIIAEESCLSTKSACSVGMSVLRTFLMFHTSPLSRLVELLHKLCSPGIPLSWNEITFTSHHHGPCTWSLHCYPFCPQ